MHPAAVNVLDAKSLISTFGELGVLVVLFLETGILLGIVLPGDSLLFVAGFASADGIKGVHLNLAWVILAAFAGAAAGAQTGFWLGERAGPPLFERRESRLFRRRYVERAHELIDRFGDGKAVVLARFVPAVRTLMNPLCGIVGMPTRVFATWNVVGAALWAVVVPLLGYWLGHVHVIANHIELLILAVVVISVVPILVELYRQSRKA